MSTWPRTPTGDLLLPRLGAPISMVQGVAAEAAISLQDKFSMWLGEWFLDQSVGFPWLRIVGQKPPPVAIARHLVRQTVLAEPGVVQVQDVEPTFNKSARDMQFPAFTARTNDGAIITGGDVPFVVKAPAGQG